MPGAWFFETLWPAIPGLTGVVLVWMLESVYALVFACANVRDAQDDWRNPKSRQRGIRRFALTRLISASLSVALLVVALLAGFLASLNAPSSAPTPRGALIVALLLLLLLVKAAKETLTWLGRRWAARDD